MCLLIFLFFLDTTKTKNKSCPSYSYKKMDGLWNRHARFTRLWIKPSLSHYNCRSIRSWDSHMAPLEKDCKQGKEKSMRGSSRVVQRISFREIFCMCKQSEIRALLRENIYVIRRIHSSTKAWPTLKTRLSRSACSWKIHTWPGLLSFLAVSYTKLGPSYVSRSMHTLLYFTRHFVHAPRL